MAHGQIAGATLALLKALTSQFEREGLQRTPERVEEAWRFWTSGYKTDLSDLMTSFSDGCEGYDELVFAGCIPVYSHCEHHLAPFWGVAHVGYIPDGRIVGLSKLTRLVDMFARRITVQERITSEVADALEYAHPIGVGVVLQCRHMCMESRGVRNRGTVTMTSALRGGMKEHGAARAEFMSMVQTAAQGMGPL